MLKKCRDCDGCTICIRCGAPPNQYNPDCDICKECRNYNLKSMERKGGC